MPTPVAQYLRMSTEHQQYSIANQIATIAAYAMRCDFDIKATYSDEARSGLLLRNRPGLQRLLKDVLEPTCLFKAILVYDVSRFGRFQDTDESAHWEFVCKSAGAPIHYCAETFANDNSLVSSIMKSLKRVMAGEYSRELSTKVYEGQKRISKLGFTMGGNPGYGLARVLVSQNGVRKRILKRGELKAIQRERVTLGPGSPREVACVREIFRMFTEERRGTARIAKELNRRKIPSPTFGKWVRSAVRRILRNPKYAGCMVYGKRTWKLCSNPAELPEHEWIVTPGAFEPIVDMATFNKAQQIRSSFTVRRSNEDILAALRQLIADRGGRFALSELDELQDLPNFRTYQDRFGGTRKVCELLGNEYSHVFKRSETCRRMQEIRKDLMQQLVNADPTYVSLCAPQGRVKKSYLRVRGAGNVGVYACRWFNPTHGRPPRWNISMTPHDQYSQMLLALLDETNVRVDRLVLVKGFRFKYRTLHIGPNNRLLKDGIVVDGMREFHSANKRLLQVDDRKDTNASKM